MKQVLFILFLLFTSQSRARILIQAETADPQSFKNYLRLHPELKSYQDSIWEELQTNSAQEQELFKLMDFSLEERKSGLTLIDKINKEHPLSPLSLNFLADLTEQWLTQNPNKNLQTEIQNLRCKVQGLLPQKKNAEHSCKMELVSVDSLKNHFPQLDLLAVESLAVQVSAGQKLHLLTSTSYHFTLISSKQRPLHFYGNFKQLLEQNWPSENLAKGSCQQPSIQINNMTLAYSGIIYFSDDCLRSTQEVAVQAQTSWWQRNKSWIYPTASILFLGGMYALKDKTLIIDTSSFQ